MGTDGEQVTWWIGIILALFLIGLNGFFVAAEFALVKVRDTQLAPLAKKGDRRARMARKVSGRLESYLNASQLGITLASLALGWVGEPALAVPLMPLFARLGLGSETLVHSAAFVVSFTVLSMMHILFGELVPKFIGLRRSLETALTSAPLLIGFRWLFWPFLAVMDRLSNLVLRLLGIGAMAHAEGALSEEEIRLLIESDESRVTDQKRALLTRVLRSAERDVRVAMKPRVDIAVLSSDDPMDVVLEQAREHEFSRFPVVRGHDPDRVVGYVHARDLLMTDGEPPPLEQIMREPLYVPETATVAAVLERMRLGQVHLAIVVDEYGGTSGLVTLEDLVEELVGEIQDEFDVESVGLTKLADGSLRASGATTVYDACLALEVEADDDPTWTLGRCAVERLGRIPRVGDRFEAGDIAIEVVAMRRRRVTETRVRATSDDERAPAEGA